MSTRSLVLVTAGLRDPSSTRMLGDRLVRATREALAERGEDVLVEVVDLRVLAHAMADHLLTGFATGDLAAAQRTVAGADAVVVVTPVFSASYSGLFKTFFDLLEPDALRGTPVLMGATAGTARHSLVLEHALRPLFSYLGATVNPTAVFAATDDFGAGSGDGVSGDRAALGERIARAGAEFAALIHTRPVRERFDAGDTVEDLGPVPDFEELLRGR